MTERNIGRAQCIVHRKNKILMVRHRLNGEELWCLPGGAIEKGETPAQAAIRELKEECGVNGQIIRETSVVVDPSCEKTCTFEVDIGNQEPQLGTDPDQPPEKQVLVDVQWLVLSDISERDRTFLWAAGLLGIDDFLREVSGWGEQISYPKLDN